MPATNPFVHIPDGAPVIYAPDLGSLAGQNVMPGVRMNPMEGGYAQTDVNAAGSSENIALHLAIIVTLAGLGIFILRQSGFKFVVSGSIG